MVKLDLNAFFSPISNTFSAFSSACVALSRCLPRTPLLSFHLRCAPPSCPWVFIALSQAWHRPLDHNALWQKINNSLLAWYGDKIVIILMLCLRGLSFSLVIATLWCPLLISWWSQQFVVEKTKKKIPSLYTGKHKICHNQVLPQC